MPLAHVALLAIAANAFSGVAALVHFKPIIPGMASAGVPESWLTFPIGTLKTAGAVGLLLGAQASMSAATGARNDTEPIHGSDVSKCPHDEHHGLLNASWEAR
jgi:hypothetical protein